MEGLFSTIIPSGEYWQILTEQPASLSLFTNMGLEIFKVLARNVICGLWLLALHNLIVSFSPKKLIDGYFH